MSMVIAMTGVASAQTPLPVCSASGKDYLYTVTNPPPADRQEIMDLIHRYNWVLDVGTGVGVDAMLIDGVTYEMCNAASTQLEKRTGKAQFMNYLVQLSDALAENKSSVRHIESNTLLNVVDQNTIEGKSTVLVTIQFTGIETPVLDYTGILRTTFKRDAGVWKFATLVLITDGPKITLRAR